MLMATRTRSSNTSLYIAFVILIILLVVTTGASFIRLGQIGAWIGVSIAVAQMLVVALVFMNLRRSPAVVRLAAATAIIWLSFYILLVMADFVSRGWIGASEESIPQANQYQEFDRVDYR